MALTLIVLAALYLVIMLAKNMMSVTKQATYILSGSTAGDKGLLDELEDVYLVTRVVTVVVVVALILVLVIYWTTPHPLL